MSNQFEVVSPFEPSGDQPEAIRQLCDGLRRGERNQVLLGVTGSGKIMRSKAYKSHIMTKKSQKRKRNFRHETEVSKADQKTVARGLGLR